MPIRLYLNKALGLIDGCSEGCEREASDLEVLLCEGDTDDGNAKNNANDELKYCEEQTAENEPERVAEGMLLKVGLNSLAEGEEGEACHLKALDAYGDTYKGHAPNKTENKPDETGDQSAGYEPKDVS